MKTAIITSNSFENHLTGDGHPEQPKRVKCIVDVLQKNKKLLWDKPREVPEKILKMTHTEDYLKSLSNAFPKKGLSFLDGDTVISPGSRNAVFDAAGSTITAIDGIEKNKFKNAFCVVRPPGHHAEKNKAMGFCCLSNAGIATNYLINKYNYKKIACVDFDVHWGNGNYNVLYDNKNSLYISTHQYPFYPGGGSENDKGKYNNSLNIPLPAGTNSEKYLNAYQRVIDRLEEYKPDYLIFSAGFDAHKDDPLAQFELTSMDFYEITKRTLDATNKFTKGKVVSVLEGGYDLNALAESALYHVNALLESQ
ncbi:MAG: histone deacetylase family protein [Rickettsiales bacterium TMED289]|nr:MAG: histone deacetylase family protein [Rickettsiales bacterium TMED289]